MSKRATSTLDRDTFEKFPNEWFNLPFVSRVPLLHRTSVTQEFLAGIILCNLQCPHCTSSRISCERTLHAHTHTKVFQLHTKLTLKICFQHTCVIINVFAEVSGAGVVGALTSVASIGQAEWCHLPIVGSSLGSPKAER